MNPTQAALLCLLLAFLLSNLPFFDNRWFARLSPVAPTAWMRVCLWLLLYATWIVIAIGIENSLGKGPQKDWSVWAISLAFFAVLAFPGITYRYLWHSRKKA